MNTILPFPLIYSSWRPPIMAPKAVPNLGGTSRMSVVLQVLMNTHGFSELLSEHVEECVLVHCFACQLDSVIWSLQSDDKELTNKLQELYEECNGEATSDACHFFLILLSKLQDVASDDSENAIKQLFSGLKKNIDECVKCRSTFSNEESFSVLNIQPSIGTHSVQEALDNHLIGPTDKSLCAACGECECVSFMELTVMPHVLCLHFLSPSDDNQSSQSRRVTIKDQLVISDVVYQFTSAILSNPNRRSAHYTCILKHDNSLLHVNDSWLKNMSYGTLLSGNFESDVFMAIYQRVGVIAPKELTPVKHGKIKKKDRVVSTSKNWTSEPFEINEINDLTPSEDSVVTEKPFIIHKRKRSRPKSFDMEEETDNFQESNKERTPTHMGKKRAKRTTKNNKKEETAVVFNGQYKTVYIRCVISYELWYENMSDKDFLFFVGLSKFNFEALYILLDGSDGMMSIKYVYEMPTPKRKTAAPLKLSAKSRLLLMLVRLRRGTPVRDLAYQFKISTAYAGFIFFGVLRKVACTFRSMQTALFLTRQQQQSNRPAPFKPFPNVRIIIDGVEFRTQVPSNFEQQKNTWSFYKHYNSFKFMVGISCYGGVTFVSEGFEGNKSDQEIMMESGLMGMLQQGDAVMCDRGFNIAPELLKIGVTTVIPPSFRGISKLKAEEQLYNSAISQARIYVEHVMGKIKEFRLVRYTIPLNMRGVMNDLVYVTAYLTNFSDRAIKPRTKKRSLGRFNDV